MTTFCYTPHAAYLADVIPFYHDGAFHLFYLHDYRDIPGHGEGTPWFRISTRDFIHFEEAGEMLPRGGKTDQDLYAYTGCVLYAQGIFHIFYTGHNPHFPPQGKPEQAVMHATSTDLKRWQKHPEDTFYAPAALGYEPNDWRDPFVFFDESDGQYHMLLAARLAGGPAVRRGCTAHCVSSDLKTWQVVEPLWMPSLYYTHECPDLFRIGDWYYLIFSEFSERCQTRYVMSRSLSGPWLSPPDDAFDTRAFYAAKSCTDGEKRYLFGWNPTRHGASDDRPFVWGGSLTVHELYQGEDGGLRVREPQSIRSQWVPQPQPGEPIPLACPDGFAEAVLLDAPASRARMTCTMRLGGHCATTGLRVGYDVETDAGYAFVFDVRLQQLRFERMPNRPWSHMENAGLVRPLALAPGQAYRLSLSMDDTLLTLYVDDHLAFSTRMYDQTGSAVACFATHGEVDYEDIVWYTWQE